MSKRRILVCAALAAVLGMGLMTPGSGYAAVSEKNDFYQAVNEKVLAEKKIKPTESSWSWFQERNRENKEFLTKKIEALAKKQGTYREGSEEQKIADLYQCITDQKTRNATAPAHLQKLVAPLQAAKTPAELTAAVCALHDRYGIDVLMDMSVQRLPDKRRYIARFEASGPVLSRYDLEKEAQPGAWQDYQTYVANVLTAGGLAEDAAVTAAGRIFAFEQKLGPTLLTSEEMNDIMVQNRQVSRQEFIAMTPHLDGEALLKAWHLEKEQTLYLADPAYLQALDAAYTADNLDLFRQYFTFRVYHQLAPYSDIPLRDLRQHYQNHRYGIRASRTEKEQASYMLQSLMPYELGQIYLKERCTPETQAAVRQIIDEVRQVYRSRLEQNTWLTAATRAKAIEKLDGLRVFVGGPAADDKPLIEDMHAVVPEGKGGDLLTNILQNEAWAAKEEEKLVGTDFNPDKWYAFNPQDVNAAYISDNNSITIPAGILQAPFYDSHASRGTNLGGIGVVIGHEISHAFDPNGSHTDKDGNLIDWWTPADHAAFQKRASAFAPYYSRYQLAPGLYENGQLVMNEAIADCGGLSVATVIAGTDESVRRDLYKSFAAIFASKYTDQLLYQLVKLDPHPNGKARVNGALSSTEGFYKAYDIVRGDGMYVGPDQRVSLW